MTTMHAPTPPERREAVLRHQAAQLLRDAAAWGYAVIIDGYPGPVIHVLPHAHADDGTGEAHRCTRAGCTNPPAAPALALCRLHCAPPLPHA